MNFIDSKKKTMLACQRKPQIVNFVFNFNKFFFLENY